MLKGLTQEELSDSICSRKQLIRIENNASSPTGYVLHLLSKKLGVEIFDYMPYVSDINAFEIKEEFDIIQELYNNRLYCDAYFFLQNSSFINNSESDYVLKQKKWYLGALSHYTDTNIHVDAEYFESILLTHYNVDSIEDCLSRNLSVLDYNIINSYIVENLKLMELQSSKSLLIKSIHHLEENNDIKIAHVYLRFIYNLSRLLFNLHEYDSAIEITLKGIRYCTNHKDVSYLADLYNILGRSNYSIGNIDDGRASLKNYLVLIKMFHMDTFDKEIERTLTEKYNL